MRHRKPWAQDAKHKCRRREGRKGGSGEQPLGPKVQQSFGCNLQHGGIEPPDPVRDQAFASKSVEGGAASKSFRLLPTRRAGQLEPKLPRQAPMHEEWAKHVHT